MRSRGPRARRARPVRTRLKPEELSRHLQHVGNGNQMAIGLRLEEELPGPRGRDEHADGQLAGGRTTAGNARGADERCTSVRAGGADVRVEIIERSGAEEDGMGKSSEPRCEPSRLAGRVGYAHRQKRGLAGPDAGMRRRYEAKAVDDRARA